MPHDKFGHVIEAGDEVLVRFTVERVYQTEGDGYCNATLETIEPMFQSQNKTTLTVNAKQVEKVSASDKGE